MALNTKWRVSYTFLVLRRLQLTGNWVADLDIGTFLDTDLDDDTTLHESGS